MRKVAAGSFDKVAFHKDDPQVAACCGVQCWPRTAAETTKSCTSAHFRVVNEVLARPRVRRQLASTRLLEALDDGLRSKTLVLSVDADADTHSRDGCLMAAQAAKLPVAHRLAGAILADDERQRLVELNDMQVVRAETAHAFDEQLVNAAPAAMRS